MAREEQAATLPEAAGHLLEGQAIDRPWRAAPKGGIDDNEPIIALDEVGRLGRGPTVNDLYTFGEGERPQGPGEVDPHTLVLQQDIPDPEDHDPHRCS